MMSNVERISTVIPTFKQQLMFLKEREKLFQTNNNNQSIQCLNTSSFTSSSLELSSQSFTSLESSSNSSTNLNLSSSSFSMESLSNNSFDESSNRSVSDQSLVQQKIKPPFPDKYTIPTLPDAVIKDIEEGDLSKFGPHYTNRQILVDAVSHDLVNNYQIFYPSHKQFDVIGVAMVEFLKLPATKNNVAVWKDALQTKLKKKRSENQDHAEVRDYQLKYARVGSGRPVKNRFGEVAQRDRQKQMLLNSCDEATLQNLQLKVEKLRDNSQMDIAEQLSLWKDSFQARRQFVRDNSTQDILKEFPGYSNPILVLEEVKMIMKVDLAAAVRRQVPVLIDKISKTFDFINDCSPIRLVKILCREFNETIYHTLSNAEPSIPYPTLVFIDKEIHVYVDFVSIVSTHSPDDALALLIAMYTIFELNFNKNSRSIRLLYAVLYAETRFLPNTARVFLKEKKIDVYDEETKKLVIPLAVPTNHSTTSTNSQSVVDLGASETFNSSIQNDETDDSDPTNISSSKKNADLISNILVDINQSSQNIEEQSSVLMDSYSPKRNSNTRKRSQRIAKATSENEKSDIFNDGYDNEDIQENQVSKSKRKRNSGSQSVKRIRRN